MRTARARTAVVAVALTASVAVACGSQTPASPTAGDEVHKVPATVMLESTGFNPREVTVAVGQSVSFMNHDSVPHPIAGGLGPSQPGCPEIAAVGVLAPGDIRPTMPFATPQTCDYHVLRGVAVLFNGRIVVR
jgi:plastocyanin